MVKGIAKFRDYFKDYTDQYVLIGGTACDIVFESNEASFRATRDLDMVIIIEALTSAFANKFWEFIEDGKYRNKYTSTGNPQFYRFDKPEEDQFPKMIELFCRKNFELKQEGNITPIHIDDEISSLSAILLDNDYYHVLLTGRIVENGLSVLRPEYLILFKAKAYLDLKMKKTMGIPVDSNNIKKHKRDILRIVAELVLKQISSLPDSVNTDIQSFIHSLINEPFDQNILKAYGLNNAEVIHLLKHIYPK